MTSPVTGEPTNMSFGFLGMVLKLLRGEGKMSGPPSHVAVVLDVSGDRETFRSTLYPDYKAHRPPPPEDLFVQVDRCTRTLGAMGVPLLGCAGFEADDVIATVVTRMKAEHPDVLIRIVSKDKDLKQLLEPGRVEMYDVHTDTVIDAASLKAETGLEPAQVIDMLALMGDSVDNVPGVEGVGPKTAAELVSTYGSLDGVVEAVKAGKIKGKRGEKIAEAAGRSDGLELSRQLVALRADVPIPFDLGACARERLDVMAMLPTLKELGFNRYQDEVRAVSSGQAARSPQDQAEGAAAAGTAAPEPMRTAAGDAGGTGGTAAAKGKRKSKSQDDAGGLFGGLFQQADSASPTQGSTVSADTGGTGVQGEFAARQAAWPQEHTYRCVRTEADLAELAAELRGAEVFAFDTETTGLSPLRDKLCGLSFCTQAGRAWYVPVRSPDASVHLDERTVLATLGPILEKPTGRVCGHNLKFDMLVLRAAGVRVGGGVPGGIGACGFDSMVASYLIDASRSSHGMDALSLALLGHTNISITELIGSGKAQRTFDTVGLELATEYAAEDADVSLRLMEAMAPQIRAMGLDGLLREVEMPLVEVLAELEFNGIAVDPAELERQRARLAGRIEQLRTQIDAEADATIGRRFNPDSPKQLAGALFNKPDAEEPGLGIKPVKRTATGYSTDVEVLETLAEDAAVQTPIPGLIVEYRQLSKLVNTYLVALAEEINPATGRIHASFNQTVAATGRLSSSDPNLQNIPIRTDTGREIRRAFVAAPGCVLISADYSQIELRLLAHLSGDPALKKAFEEDQDIHAAVAAQIHGVPLDQVTREQRSGAKMVNFGIVYGITGFGLGRRLGIGTREAEAIITQYKQRFAGITTFLQECVAQAERMGYVETMLKRRRPIPDIVSTNPSRRALAERMAINSVVQGSAADLIKMAMVNIQRKIAGGAGAFAGVKMLLQIHDELVFEAAEGQAAGAMAAIVKEMEGAMQLSVPLKADAGMGANWFDVK